MRNQQIEHESPHLMEASQTSPRLTMIIKYGLGFILLSLSLRFQAQPDLMNVMPNGNVGIGTSLPQFPLDMSAHQSVLRMTTTDHVNGSVIELKNNLGSPQFLGALNFNNLAGTTPGQIAYFGNHALTLRTNGFERMRIDDDGKVGVGTATPESNLSVGGSGFDYVSIWGETMLENGVGISGLARNTGNFTNWGGLFQANGHTGIGVVGRAIHDGAGTNYGGDFRADAHAGRGVRGIANGVLGHGVHGETAGASGVGVFGKATGGSSIGVQGEATSTAGTAVWGLASNTSGTNYGGYFQANGNSGYGVNGTALGANGKGVAGLATGSSGRGVHGLASSSGEDDKNYGGYFQSDGGNGVGVYGFVNNDPLSGLGFGLYGETGRGAGVYGICDGEDGVGVYGIASGNNGGSHNRGVVGDGHDFDFYAAGIGVNYGTRSSLRWKKNIVDIENPLEKLEKLRGVYFDWDQEHGGSHDVGMIAEEVGKVLPEIVVYEENGIDADGMDYSKLTPLLVEAVKAQQTLLRMLTKRIEELESNSRSDH